MHISQRLTSIPVSATLGVDRRAKALAASGADVISFCVGEPDFPIPAEAAASAVNAVNAGNMKYTDASGTRELKEAVCSHLLGEYGAEYDPSGIVITTGAKYACYAAVCALCDPGDEVILPAPYWTSYVHLIRLAGAVPVVIECPPENGFKLTGELLSGHITDRTRAIIINNPVNPTGSVYSRQELLDVCGTAADRDLTIISDEIYSSFTFTDEPFTSVVSLSNDIKEHAVLISGMSKCYAMTGWRIGYIAAPPELAKAVSAMLSHTTGSPCTVGQAAAVEALRGDGSMTKAMTDEFRLRRDLICRLADKAGIRYARPDGAFYLFIDVREHLKEGFGSAELALDLLEKEHVACVPCDDFGCPGFLRLSYTLSRPRIEEGMDRINRYLKEL